MSDFSGSAPPVPTSDAPYGVGTLLATGFGGVFGHFGAFLVAAALPWLLAAGLQIYFTHDMGATLQAAIASNQTGSGFLLAFQGKVQSYMWIGLAVSLVTGIIFAVSWHRFMLGHGLPSLVPAPGKRHLVFFLYTLLLALPIVLGLIIGGFVARLIGGHSFLAVFIPIIACALAGFYLSLRMNLCLPAAATEVWNIGPAASWEAMKGRVGPLFLASLAATIPGMAVIVLISLGDEARLLAYFQRNEGFVLIAVLQAATHLLALLVAALNVGVLSQALRSLIPDPRRF